MFLFHGGSVYKIFQTRLLIQSAATIIRNHKHIKVHAQNNSISQTIQFSNYFFNWSKANQKKNQQLSIVSVLSTQKPCIDSDKNKSSMDHPCVKRKKDVGGDNSDKTSIFCDH